MVFRLLADLASALAHVVVDRGRSCVRVHAGLGELGLPYLYNIYFD